jgi:type II secretory pathway pseudopilin PulG
MKARTLGSERGYAMAALLVGLSVMAVAMSMLLPAWRTMAQREKEAELMFRGNQYARAIRLYNQARQSFPPDIDVLVREKFLRKKYKDPITNDDFQVIRFGQPLPGQVPTQQPTATSSFMQRGPGGQAPPQAQQQQQQQGRLGAGAGIGGGAVIGVVSKSTGTSLRVVNGRNKYNEIAFVPTEVTTQAGTGGRGTNQPGGVGTNQPGGPRGTAFPGGARGAGGRGGARGATPLGPTSGGRGLQLPGRGQN